MGDMTISKSQDDEVDTLHAQAVSNDSLKNIQLVFTPSQQPNEKFDSGVQHIIPQRPITMIPRQKPLKPSDEILPMTPEYVQRNFLQYLTCYEKTEIINYRKVWYLGKKTSSTMSVAKKPQPSNFDNEGGIYRSIVDDHLAYRFQIVAVIGKGYSGEVLKCLDHKTKQLVAVKVIRNKDNVLKLAKSEMRVLKVLQESDKHKTANIVYMREHLYFRNHLCIVFDLYDEDLYKVIKNKDRRPITEEELKIYTIDILTCLQLLKRKRIVHGDLKPENILVHKKNDVKHTAVTDFGGSFFTIEKNKPPVFTLNYMSPELLLGKRCRAATDMWSLGCIIAELHLNHRLFKGPDTHSIFSSIMQLLGFPPEEVLADSPERSQYFDSKGNPRRLEQIEKTRTSLAKIIKSKDPAFLNFIESCLEYDPKKRLTPEKALLHPWIAKKVALTSSTISDKMRNSKKKCLPA